MRELALNIDHEIADHTNLGMDFWDFQAFFFQELDTCFEPSIECFRSVLDRIFTDSPDVHGFIDGITNEILGVGGDSFGVASRLTDSGGDDALVSLEMIEQLEATIARFNAYGAMTGRRL